MEIRIGHDRYGPTPEPGWQEALTRIAPRTEYGHDWLLLRWEAGDAWDPVERWFIWQMTPVHRIPSLGILEALRGPNPRNFGHFDKQLRRFVRARNLPISLQQWRLFQETGCFGRPLWVIQGWNAGHLRRFTDVQSSLSLMMGGPEEPPTPGELLYADFDVRVIEKLKFLDVVEKYGDILNVYTNDALRAQELDRRERAMVTEMGRQLWNWLGSQVQETLNPGRGDGWTREQVQAIWDHADPDAPEPDYEAIEEEFVETVAHGYSN